MILYMEVSSNASQSALFQHGNIPHKVLYPDALSAFSLIWSLMQWLLQCQAIKHSSLKPWFFAVNSNRLPIVLNVLIRCLILQDVSGLKKNKMGKWLCTSASRKNIDCFCKQGRNKLPVQIAPVPKVCSTDMGFLKHPLTVSSTSKVHIDQALSTVPTCWYCLKCNNSDWRPASHTSIHAEQHFPLWLRPLLQMLPSTRRNETSSQIYMYSEAIAL